MRKLVYLPTVLASILFSTLLYAAATRTIDADQIKSSDHTKTWVMPGVSGTLANTAEIAAHEADTTNIHGIADTSLLLTTSTGLQKSNNLSDVANAGTSRTNLGLGTMATQNANSVAITAGTINADFQGGTASNTSRITVPSAVKSTLDGLTRKEATVVYATDTDKLYVDNGSTLTAVGTGSTSGVEILPNPDFDGGITDWTASGGTFAAAAGSNIGYGAGGATWDSNGAGQTLCSTLTAIPEVLKSNNGEGSIWIKVPSGTATHTYSVTDGTTTVTGSVTSSTVFKQHVINYPFPSSGSVKLCLTSVAADEPLIAIDSAHLGSVTNIGSVSAISDWQTFTPTGSWVSNSTYTGYYRQVGDNVEFRIKVATAGAPTSASLTFTLPFSWAMDTTKILHTVASEQILGWGQSIDTGVAKYPAIVTYNSSTTVLIRTPDDSTNGLASADVTQAAPFSFGAGDSVVVNFTVPISGFTSSRNAIRADQSNYEWTSWSPISVGSQGFGTIAADSCFHKRDGQYLLMECKFTAGTVAASEARITLPNSLTVSSTVVPTIRLAEGFWVRSNASATTTKRGAILMNGGNAYINFSLDDYNATVNPLLAANGSSIFANSDVISFYAKIPITTWGENQKAPILYESVTTNGTAKERTERAYITNSGSPTVSTQSGSWISSLTDNGVGDTTINIASGIFSAAPVCFVSLVSANATITSGAYKVSTNTGPSATQIRVTQTNMSATAIDTDFMIECQGAR